MTSVEVHLIKAFTSNPHEGNPAGVVLDADELDSEKMLRISAELGFSESAFVSTSEKADFRIRFFTPVEEVSLCGHGTLAAVHALREAGRIAITGVISQETKAGLLQVEVQDNGLMVMSQSEPVFFDNEINRIHVSNLLGLKAQDLTDWPLKIVSTGTPKLLIPIKSLTALLSIHPDLEGIKQFCRDTGARGFFAFTGETQSSDTDFHARQFNPLAGIDEDPITGIAAGALGAYLKHFQPSSKKNFVVEQGYSLGKPGKIFVNTEKDIRVGGYAVAFGTTTIRI
jgi:PhzF family phenazine biosynthesis protein